MSDIDATQSDSSNAGAPVVVVDLGKHKRKSIKKLRKGEGKLMERVQDAIDELRSGGTLSADAQTVVVIVGEKKKSAFAFLR